MTLTAEDVVNGFIGQTAKTLKLTVINVNSDPTEGSKNDKKGGNCIEFIDNCLKFFPEIQKNINKEADTRQSRADKVLAEKFHVPFLFSPSSFKMLRNPIDFGGDHTSEALYTQLGMYATHQLIPVWSNTNLCPLFASKRMFDFTQVKQPKVLIPEEGFGAREIEYSIERGVCNSVGVKSADSCRYIASHKIEGGKQNVVMICGDHSFLGGQSTIFKRLFESIEAIRKHQHGNKFNGISLSDVSVHSTDDDDSDVSKRVINANSIAIARLLGGSIITHDYLMILRDIYGVKKLMSFDVSSKEERSAISIDVVIRDFAIVKKYALMSRALKTIR